MLGTHVSSKIRQFLCDSWMYLSCRYCSETILTTGCLHLLFLWGHLFYLFLTKTITDLKHKFPRYLSVFSAGIAIPPSAKKEETREVAGRGEGVGKGGGVSVTWEIILLLPRHPLSVRFSWPSVTLGPQTL